MNARRVGVVIYQKSGKWYASLVHGCGYVARPLWCQAASRRALLRILAEAMPS